MTNTENNIQAAYLKLQNGSDIRGTAIPGVREEQVNLDEQAAFNIGRAFSLWLAGKTKTDPSSLVISSGRDPRLSGEKLSQFFSAGALSTGAAVYDCGLASTPAMFMSTIFDSFNCDGAVMITASHLPFNRNGFKFFDKDGGLNKEDIKNILMTAADIAGSFDLTDINAFGKPEKKNLMDRYCLHLCELISDSVKCSPGSLPLEGLKIVVDAGNGSGGFYAGKVLEPLGATVTGCFLEPDGSFPNHIPNPENREAMKSICTAVKENNADLGIIFDTDVDRSSAVDENGCEIARNGIVALAAALISEKHPNTTVVTDSITSKQLSTFLEEELGMKHLRFKRGYRNVINKAIQLGEAGEECHLAIETSGHAAIKDNYFLDDGAYLATLIVIKAAQLLKQGKKISSMISSLNEPADACEIRMKINSEDFSAVADKILAELEEWVISNPDFELITPNYEGVRADYKDGWFLLRKSLHDPIMPLNIESEHKNGCGEIAAALKEFLSEYEELDTSEIC